MIKTPLSTVWGEGSDELKIDQLTARDAIIARGGAGDNTIDASLTKAVAMAVFGGVDWATGHLRNVGVALRTMAVRTLVNDAALHVREARG